MNSNSPYGAISEWRHAPLAALGRCHTGPRHIHHAEDETFVILTGACRVWIEGEEQLLNAGQSAFIPRGKEHTFQPVGDQPCRHLVILTPGGFEGFFTDMAAGKFAIPDDMPSIVESGERHNMTFTGPPLD